MSAGQHRFQSIDLRIPNHRGQLLAARLELPEAADYFAVFSPCFTCTKETLATYRISRHLAEMNIAVLRIDFSGLGDSEGDFADTTFSGMIDDIKAASDYLAEHYQSPRLLVGHSMGGTASYAAATQLDTIKAVCSIASPCEPSHVLHHFGGRVDELRQGQSIEFDVAGTLYSINPGFVEDVERYHASEYLPQVNTPALILHAENDTLVPAHHAEDIYRLLSNRKSRVSLDTADHILSAREDARYCAELLHSWATRYCKDN